jgi:hypothetical protein
MKAVVLPGHRIEISTPELPEGATVELIVLPEGMPAALPAEPGEPRLSALDLIASFPSGPRSAPSFEEIERNFRQERDAWER